MVVDRSRRLIVAMPFLAGISSVSACLPEKGEPKPTFVPDNIKITAIEKRIGGRVGVALMDSKGEIRAAHRGQERFAMCSTFKAPLAAAMLAAHDKGKLDQYAPVTITKGDLVPYAPFAERMLRENRPTSLYELAEKTVDYSDNAAANIILRALGGPEALTAFFAEHGGAQTRLDRIEPEMNENAIGDPRDTTTPISMAGLMRNILIKASAGQKNADILSGWLVKSATGKERIEAGIPASWKVGDKTGTAPSSAPAYNDVAIIWPHQQEAIKAQAEPYILAIYTDRPHAPAQQVDKAIAEIANILVPIMAVQG
jgi:beta-lactamase class A